MKVDYLIVGCGLAGINFSEILKENNKSFVVFDNASQYSSTVAAGLYNPVVLKRFTPVWKSNEQLEMASQVYSSLEKKLDQKLDYKLSIRRVFHSIEEQNNWTVASDRNELKPYLSSTFLKNNNVCINAPFGFGEVLHSGRIDTTLLITQYRKLLQNQNRLVSETFDYKELIYREENITYKKFSAKHILFAEGFGLKNNPFFKDLPLKGTKGELLTIHAPELRLNYILKSNVFIIPYGEHIYKVGATYEWTDKTNNTTTKALQELLFKLEKLINCSYEVIDQYAGIRPTVIDRRPLVGTHSMHKNFHVLNGLGTRGVMIAPYASKALYDNIENGLPLDKEIDIKRFLA